jgi:hypothetical protein
MHGDSDPALTSPFSGVRVLSVFECVWCFAVIETCSCWILTVQILVISSV